MEVSSTTREISKVLQGVCAYVEVRSKFENRSNVVAEELRKLGAEINDKLNMNVTHVVFKDGSIRTWERAKKLAIPLVSVLWVDSCKKSLEHTDENAFPVESPNKGQKDKFILFPVKRKVKKFRSMQPKELTEEFEDSSQRCHRRRKRTDKNKTSPSSCLNESITSCSFDMMPHLTTPPSMKAKLLERSKLEEIKNCSSGKEGLVDLKKNLFNNAENISPNQLSPQPQLISPISYQENLPETLDLSEFVNARLKERSKSPDLPDDVKQPSENLSNSCKKNLKINDEITTASLGSVQNESQKQNSVCDSTSNHFAKSSDPFSPISTNMCNISMDDFILIKPVHRKRYKHRETLDILGVTESNLHDDNDHLMGNSDQNKNVKMSEIKPVKISDTHTETLSSSKAEQVTCPQTLKENGALFCSTPVYVESGCTQSNNNEERLQQEFECLKTIYGNFDNMSQSSSQSVAFSMNQAPLLLNSVSKNYSQSLSESKEKRNLLAFRKPIKKYLVMTSMNSSEQEMVKSVTKALGGSVISDNVRKSTTHVICGNSRRTLNLLHGLIQGCWLLSKKWVIKSMEAGKWIDERKFEMTDDYPATQIYRQNKQKQSLQIFKSCGPMFISTSTAPPRKDLVHFVQFCGGQVTTKMCDADFYVGEEYNPFLLSISPQWILDSVTNQKACSLENYQLGQPKPPSPEY